MPRRSQSLPDDIPSRSSPATTPEARETEMINLAETLAERQLRDGSASSQVITHYLKLGSSRERLEQEKIALETELVQAKTEAIANQARSEELFAKAIEAMSHYQGRAPKNFEAEDQYQDD